MAAGEFDAALVTVGAFDQHRRRHPDSPLVLDSYRHPIGFNLGFLMLADNPGLLDAVNQALRNVLHAGEVGQLASAHGVHYAPPREPVVRARLTMHDIITRTGRAGDR